MKITVLSVGTIKEKYFIDAIKEYSKRISKYSKVDFITVSDEPIPDNASLKEEEIIKNKEGEKILKSIPSNSYKIALDLNGEMLDSVELAKKISDIFTHGNSNIVFIIGGSLGLSKNVIGVCDYRLCFSKMTFPHKLMQVILLEQVYRAFKINNNETYHK
ncbi:MAG: 23S rRNA (pseudouridine(1915)-N(3))-methyltransferase RlmH [Acholeplasmatales bacterium]|nr:23S rRNA (pseudouridine(1915)-N(3))-methyltransferase RlmH [Acholeplasmatales bacterium]